MKNELYYDETRRTVRQVSQCRFCGSNLVYVHGHGMCPTLSCAFKNQNQEPCCDGEVIDTSRMEMC